KEAAKQLNCEFDHLQKTRLSGSEVVITEKKLDVKGMDVIMLDDIISTGGTIAEAAKLIKSWKPASVNVGCVHGLFLKGIEMFQGAADRIVATNTLDNPVSRVSVAGVIARHLKR
ncbi:MAG: phosphoribosyltransferase family protein, partial [Candidatus Altiarchaeota archaeon]|nr:phosphoribosyltransferase family protein [Candidatus Altiarchaeota archaeon]